MLDRMTQSIDFHGQALALRARRQEVLSSNIANADTPGFKARDFDFASALRAATGATASAAAGAGSTLQAVALARPQPGHLAAGGAAAGGSPALKYVTPEQGTLDANTVDLNRERAQFADNTLRYEASLRFLGGSYRTMLAAIRGE